MLGRPLAIAAGCLASLTALALPAHAKPKVAVLGLEVIGQGATDQKTIESARALTRELRREVNRPTGSFELAPNSNKDLLDIKMLSDCFDEGRRCMSDIGKKLGAERLIYGKLERKKSGYEVSLRLLNTENTELEAQAEETIPFEDLAEAGGLNRHARAILGKLTGAPEDGVLTITANAERGTVMVNGQMRTSLSAGSARVTGIPAGPHTVTIEAEGFEAFESDVTIASGKTQSLRAQLTPLDESDEDGRRPGRGWRIAFWSGMVATGVGGGGFVVSWLSLSSAQSELPLATDGYRRMANDGVAMGEVRGDGEFWDDACEAFKGANESNPTATRVNDTCRRGKRWSTLTAVFGYPAIAVGVFTAVAGYMGYVAPRGSSGAERSVRRPRERSAPRREITVLPSIGPDLLGAGLEIKF